MIVRSQLFTFVDSRVGHFFTQGPHIKLLPRFLLRLLTHHYVQSCISFYSFLPFPLMLFSVLVDVSSVVAVVDHPLDGLSFKLYYHLGHRLLPLLHQKVIRPIFARPHSLWCFTPPTDNYTLLLILGIWSLSKITQHSHKHANEIFILQEFQFSFSTKSALILYYMLTIFKKWFFSVSLCWNFWLYKLHS